MEAELDLAAALDLGERVSRLCQTDARGALREAERFVARVGRGAPAGVRAVARRARGHAHRGNFDFRRALTDYRAALHGFAVARLPLERARTAIGMTDVLANLNRPAEALALAAGARRTLRAAGEWRRVARLDVNIANLHLRHDRFVLALASYRAAERRFAQAGLDRDLALARFNVANVLVEQGRFAEALPAFASSAGLLEREGADRALVQCHLAHADACARLGRLGDALALAERARLAAAALGELQLEAMSAVALARLLIATGRHADAGAALDRAVAGFGAAHLRWDEGTTLALRARWHARAGRITPARADLDAAAGAFRAVGQASLATWSRIERIRLGGPRRLERGERLAVQRAAERFREGRQGVHEIEARLMLVADAGDRRDAASARAHLRRIAALLARHADPWLEQQWALASAATPGVQPERALAHLERAAAVADQLRSRIPEETMRAAFSAEQADIVERALEIVLGHAAGARGARRAFMWCERAHVPRLGTVAEEPAERRRRPRLMPAGIARLQQGLAPGEVLLEYFVGRAAVHRFVLTRKRLAHARLAIDPERLRARVFALRRLWDRCALDARGGMPRRATLRASERDLLATLDDDLLAGAFDDLKDVAAVTIVPHAWLRDVPFHALGGDAPLAATVRVEYLLGARERLREPRRRPAGDAAPLVVGVASPLAPSAEREARAVAACHAGARVLCGAEATPKSIRAAWARARLIHVATHATRDLDEPRRSGVQLAAGAWTAFDVAGEDLAADLVVLSGCRTGDAVVWGGDEAFGLLPALREAGDAAVLVSLWSVDDGAADAWMQRFHRALAAGASAAEAWHQSVSEARAGSESAYHWAPFALYAQRGSQGR